MDDHTSFGYWVRRRRKALDLTQEALATQISCSLATVHKIETDERRPSRQMAELLAQALQIAPPDRARFLQVARAQRSTEQLAGLASVVDDSAGSRRDEAPTSLPTALPAPPQSTLPTSPTPLVGRNLEVGQIVTLLHDPTCRLLTLVGPGGIGKTRLALAAAYQFPAGSCFVALAAVSAPEFLAETIARSLGLTLAGVGDPKAQLFNYLRPKRLLLVLDNLEHLLDGVELVAEILQIAPAISVLATSRERLNVQGEWIFEVQGLPVPGGDQTEYLEEYSAVALFVQSARRVCHSFALAELNRQHVVRICRLVEGMPLGIELAAAWVHLLSCEEVAQEIQRTIDFLAVNQRDVPPRHRSLRAAFDHSWQLLSREEQRVLRQLAVFQGGFTRQAAEQVAQTTLPMLAALVAKSLLHRTENGRYELHELVRQYAYDWLRAAGEEDVTQSRHLTYFQQLVETAFRPLLTTEQPIWVKRLSAEYDNLRAALAWALANQKNITVLTAGLRLGGALYLFWWLGEHYREGATWLRQLLAVEVKLTQEAEQLAYQPARAKALYGAATLMYDQREFQQALVWIEESLRLCRSLDDQWGIAFSLFHLSALAVYGFGEVQRVSEYAQESATLFRQLDDKRHLSLAIEVLGYLARRRGDFKAAVALWEEGLALNRASGDPTGIAQASDRMAQAWLRQGDYARAQMLLEESLDVYRQLGNRYGAAYALFYLGRIAHAQHDYGQAKQRYAESQAIFAEFGSKEVCVLIQQGRLSLDEGDTTTAHATLVHSLAQAEGGAEYVIQAQITLAMIWLAEQRYAETKSLLSETLTRAQALHDNDYIAQVLCGWARLALVQGEHLRAVRLLGAALGLWKALGLPASPELQEDYEQGLQLVYSQLDEVSFHTAWTEGQGLSLEQAISFVLAVN